MKTTIYSLLSNVRTTAMVPVLSALLGIGAPVFAENMAPKDSISNNDKTTKESNASGFQFSFPAYMYSKYSAFGIQGGYQFKKVQVRLDLSLVNDYENGKDIWFAMPSLGIFYSHTWHSKIRTYEGITVGGEKGLKNSFKGNVGFVNYLAGVESMAFEGAAFFFEIGTGGALEPKDGAFSTGTIMGGGFKYYFSGKKRDHLLLSKGEHE